MGELTPITERIDNYLNEYNQRINEYRLSHPQKQGGEEYTDLDILKRLAREDIAKGKLPQLYQESDHAIEMPKYLQAYIHQILDDFLKPEENKKHLNEEVFGNLRDAKLFLSDMLPLNAYIFSGSKPPIIVFTKGNFIDKNGKAQLIDLLAHILGHELSHPIEQTYSTTKSNQTSEHICDLLGVSIANKAGYSPMPILKFWQDNSKKNSTIPNRILATHPLASVRKTVNGSLIGALELKGHSISPFSKTKYSKQDIEHLNQIHVLSPLEKLLNAIEYEQASLQEKKEAFIHLSKYLLTQRIDLFLNEHSLYASLFKQFDQNTQNEITEKLLSIRPKVSDFSDRSNLSNVLIELFSTQDVFLKQKDCRLAIRDKMRQLPIETAVTYMDQINQFSDAYLKTEDTVAYKLLAGIPFKTEDLTNKTLLPWRNFLNASKYSDFYTDEYLASLNTIAEGKTFEMPWAKLIDHMHADTTSEKDKDIISTFFLNVDFNKTLEKISDQFKMGGSNFILDLNERSRFIHPFTTKEAYLGNEKYFLNQQDAFYEEELKKLITPHSENSKIHPFDIDAMFQKRLDTFIEKYGALFTPRFTYNESDLPKQTKAHKPLELLLDQLQQIWLDDGAKKGYSYFKNFYEEKIPKLINRFYQDEKILDSFHNYSRNVNQDTFYESMLNNKMLDIYITPENPLIQYLKTPAGKQVNLEAKLFLLCHTPLTKNIEFDTSKKFDELFNYDFYEVLGISQPKTFKELEELSKKLYVNKNFANSYMNLRASNTLLQIRNYITRTFLKELNLEDYKDQYIDLSKVGYQLRQDEHCSDETNQILAKIAEHNYRHLLYSDLKMAPEEELAYICTEYQKYNNQGALFKDLRNADDQFLHYYALSDHHYNYNEALEEKIMKMMRQQIKTADPIYREDLYKLASKILKETPPANNQFKNFLIETIAELHFKRIGMEKESSVTKEEFVAQMTPDAYLKDFSGITSASILCRLMEKAETQKDVSLAIRDKIQTVNGNKIDAQVQGLREGLICSHQNNFNIDLLDFLKQPLTPQSANKIVYTINKKLKYNQGVFFAGLLSPELKRHIDFRAQILDQTKQTAMANFHRQFWGMPPEAQALIMQSLLFDPTKGDTVNTQKIQEYYNIIKEEMNKDIEYAAYQTMALDTYFENCESLEAKALFISILYTMNPPQKVPFTSQSHKMEKRKQRPGEVIKKILSQMGAAGGKTLQAIHSYPGTSDSIKEDLKDSKSNFNPPKRYEIFESIENAETFDDGRLKGQTPYVGRLLGSGSFGFTVEVKDEPEAQTGHALTMLHPNALETANNQFKKFFTPISKKLAGKNKKLFGALPSIITQARHLTAIEADFLVGGEQTKVAEAQYSGIQVQSDGYDFQIKAAHIDDFGRRFKKTELASGEHFNDLPTNTNQEQAYKKAVAKAIFTTELYTLLQMGPIDSDRHGAQVRVDGTNITLFDHGAIDFERNEKGKDKNGHTVLGELRPYIPSVSERRQLGKLIANAFKRSQKGEDFTSALVDVLSKDSQRTTFKDVVGKLFSPFLKNKESRPKLSATMQRALLALGDYIEAMGNTLEERSQAVQECLSSVMQHKEQLDDVLLVSIARGLPKKMLQQLSSPSAQTSSSLQLVDNNPYPKNPTPAFERLILNWFMPRSKQEEQASSLTTRQAEQNKALIKRIREKELTAQAEEKQASKKTSAPSSFLVDRGGR